jgi:hypothetical protein
MKKTSKEFKNLRKSNQSWNFKKSQVVGKNYNNYFKGQFTKIQVSHQLTKIIRDISTGFVAFAGKSSIYHFSTHLFSF